MINGSKKIIGIFIYFLFTITVTGQTISLRGIVKDSLENSLPYVSILAKPKISTQSMKFAISDDIGRYKLELVKNVVYTVTTSHLGYKIVEFEFVSSTNSQKDILLFEEINQLNEVIIELPVIVKKDTIIYNTDKFVTGEERKLKDILNKLPGIEVDEDGNVTSNGKNITHLLVEGKKFFKGDTKLAVENIPANAVDKIMIIDDYNEVSFLKGMTDADNMAMNVMLKKNKKNFVFGDLEAGKGENDYYKTHSNLFYYTPNFNFNFIGDLNNTGEKTFSFKDYMNFKGGPSGVFNERDYNLDKDNFSQFLEPLNIISSNNKMAALNITRVVSSKIDISSYLIFSHSKSKNQSETVNQYVIPNFNYIENVTNNGDTNTILGIGKFNLEYKSNNKEQWYLKLLAKKTSNFNNTSILSETNTEIKSIITSIDAENTYIDINLEGHKRVSKKHTFSFNTYFTYDEKTPNSIWATNQPILLGLVPLTVTKNYRLNLIRREKKNIWNTIFKHYWVLSKKSQFYTTIGNEYRKSDFFTNDSQELDDGNIVNFSSAGFNNNLNYKFNDLYIGISFKFKTGIFQFRQSLFAHNYSWNIDQTISKKRSKLLLLPDFSTSIKFSQSEKIKLSYGLESSFSDVSKFANRFYLQSYNFVYRGNEKLENELQHHASIFYMLSNLYRGFFLLSEFSYTKKIKGVKDLIQTDGTDNFISSILLDNPSENLRGDIILNKAHKNIKYSLRAKVITSNFLESINSNIITNRSTNGSYKFSIKSLHEKFPIIEVGLKQSIGKYTSNNLTSKFTTNEPFISIDYDFLKKFIFSFDYTNYKYQNKSLNQTSNFNLTDAMISYGKEDSPWSFKIVAQNLFNEKFKNKNSFNSYIISDTKTFTLPRIVMLSIIYKL